ncbi:hypothetical protein [Tenggerimyces flavus]|uniref:Uncharacterized protein n=1 Tax=Tenggerimyces flavus TaxID=1708749 RepID=A0ABV7Y9L2_9ACTN|nr:hypothetical protein [Tenggerimyces flavus]MBM7788845.1 Holliday junction resolvasome RuvABC endonuclease subunit [Tenggerimyces flavus]
MPDVDAEMRDRLVRVETKLDIVIGQHDARLVALEKAVASLNALRWIAVGASAVAVGSGGISLISLVGGP